MIERGILKEEASKFVCPGLLNGCLPPCTFVLFTLTAVLCWALSRPGRCNWIKYGHLIMCFLRWGQEEASPMSLMVSESKQGQCELAQSQAVKLSHTDFLLICLSFWSIFLCGPPTPSLGPSPSHSPEVFHFFSFFLHAFLKVVPQV